MKSIISTICFCLLNCFCSGQIFQPFNNMDFPNVSLGSNAIGDIDNDGDIDIFHSGGGLTNIGWLQVFGFYLNDSNGNFSPSQFQFTNDDVDMLEGAKNVLRDVDNDGDLDFFSFGFSNVVMLFLNNGVGEFSPSTNVFIHFDGASFDFSDIDNDGDLDLLTMGILNGVPETMFYLNDGSGSFELAAMNPFQPLFNGDIEFGDLDGDDDMDLVITGNNGAQNLTFLYFNDGFGNFTESTQSFLAGLNLSCLSLVDIDSDDDYDIVHLGTESLNIYKNNGNGVFELKTEMTGGSDGTIGHFDLNNDGLIDLLVSGDIDVGEYTTKVLINNGDFTFSEVLSTDHGLMSDAFIDGFDFFDSNGDSLMELFVSGCNNSCNDRFSIIYSITPLVSNTKQVKNLQTFEIYPNPVNLELGYFTIKMSEKFNNGLDFKMIDSKGNVLPQIFIEKHNSNEIMFEIRIDNYIPGSYFLCLEDGESIIATKQVLVK